MKNIFSLLLALSIFLAPASASAVIVDSYRYTSSSSCNPTILPSLALWLDAADTATITESSGLVSQWNDKSGNGYNFTQGTGSRQPTTGARPYNGKNAVDFTGDDYMIGPSGLYGLTAGANTIFVVYVSDNTVTDQRILSGSNDGVNSRLMVRHNSSTAVEGRNTSASDSAAKSRTSDTTAHVIILNRNGGTLSVYHDGGTPATGSAQDVTLTSLVMGTAPGLASGFLDGRILEVGVFSSSLSTSNMNIYGNCLATKWSNPWSNT